ncbi:PilZ domain-containing protein [Vallicoccus soli]|uniref:PilZ domain-containing protein n=1 Tax=Vallicoccus soli TaxID=2339232 RepID=A0A3A3YST5_9ACTN|nr:PilZ domain-containing protein [Vallicoccus soli]RJK92797.1 hypothetical protein D5H78_18255 [Vallicoccus soli]
MSLPQGADGEQAPPAGTVVRVDVASGELLVPVGCVVVSSGGDELVLEPAGRGSATARPGGAVVVRWTAARGLHEVPGVLTAVGQRWRVRPTGPAGLVQRRRYARAAVQAPVAVVPVGGEDRRVVGGWLVDLGEGGVRAHLELDEGLDAGTPVQVHVTLEDEPLALTGRVLRTTDPRGLRAIGTATARLVEVVVAFEEPVDHGASIRRSVLREQARARRSARAGGAR